MNLTERIRHKVIVIHPPVKNRLFAVSPTPDRLNEPSPFLVGLVFEDAISVEKFLLPQV
jgi:hypothetical protein